MELRGNLASACVSIKNPRSGHITVDSVGEVILGDAVMECTGEVIVRG